MRSRVALVASLALFVAVGCDQQPLEPALDADLAQATFGPNPGAIVYTNDVSWTMDVCGVDLVDFSGTVRTVVNESQWGPDDRVFRIMYKSDYNLTGIGQTTGYQWRAIGSERGYVHTYWAGKAEPQEGPEKQLYNYTIKFIGQGQAPDFVGRGFGHETTNANGEKVLEFSMSIPDCS
jgi:hypothetical protein